jgi:hypothetical protein
MINQYYVIFGGKNDQIYSDSLKTVALNDLHLLDTTTNTWVTVALFGDSIPSRWGHSMVVAANSLLIFRGMNL